MRTRSQEGSVTRGTCAQANRDYTMRMWGSGVVDQFNNVFQEDMKRGSVWHPSTSLTPDHDSKRAPM